MWKTSLFDTTKVTVELREIVDAGVNVWDFDYPSYYKGEEKRAFEQKVLDHYAFRQIGQETVGRWLHMFRTRVREIMPFYIDLYKSVELMRNVEDPFQAYDLTETYTENRTGTGKVNTDTDTTDNETVTREGEKTTTANNTKRFSNTPQGSVDNLDDYMTEATVDNGDGTETDNGTDTRAASGNTSTETNSENSDKVEYTMTRKGNIGVQPLGTEILAYRAALVDVDMKVIQELNDLFLGVY